MTCSHESRWVSHSLSPNSRMTPLIQSQRIVGTVVTLDKLDKHALRFLQKLHCAPQIWFSKNKQAIRSKGGFQPHSWESSYGINPPSNLRGSPDGKDPAALRWAPPTAMSPLRHSVCHPPLSPQERAGGLRWTDTMKQWGGWGGGQRKVEMARGAIEVGEFWQMAIERTLLTATKEEEEEKSVGYSACQSRCFTLQSFTQLGASSVSLSVCYFVSSFVIPPTWQSVGLSSLSVTGSPWASLFPRCWIVFSTLDLSTSSSLSINNLVQSFSLTFIKSDSQPLSFLRQTDRRQCKEQTSPSSRCVLGSKTPKSQITNWQTETPDSK